MSPGILLPGCQQNRMDIISIHVIQENAYSSRKTPTICSVKYIKDAANVCYVHYVNDGMDWYVKTWM